MIGTQCRNRLAELGFRSIAEAVGQVDALDTSDGVNHWKAAGLDLRPILYSPPLPEGASRLCTGEQDHGLDHALDQTLIQLAAGAINHGDKVSLEMPIRNVNRTVGTMLGHHLTKKWGGEGLPDDTIEVDFTGSAGNSFGAFVPKGITLRLTGDANDYVGKGLSGGHIVVRPPDDVPFAAEDNVIAGNVILYGATDGEVFLRGRVGERFCVRNSGAVAVVEGIGDHGCEYMTGGRAVILGEAGRNFGAGMSGGIAFVLDDDDTFVSRVNPEMVDIDPLTDEDIAWLRDRIEQHRVATGSTVADRLLADWDTTITKFKKIMPADYKRVLEAVARAEAEGTDVDEAVMAASQS